MKSKLNPVFIIVGLFLFKVGIVDNFRNMGHNNGRYVATEAPTGHVFKPIR
ncbi:MAG: hypothetical protein ACXVLQ_08890 [Bacteriovorax sp.]